MTEQLHTIANDPELAGVVIEDAQARITAAMIKLKRVDRWVAEIREHLARIEMEAASAATDVHLQRARLKRLQARAGAALKVAA